MHLDMLRGLASLAVVSGHVRACLFVHYGDVISSNVAVKVVYFLTSLGHQAVIAFFALSGYLVGGAALKSMIGGRWSLTDYAVARLSRLWTVVVPALALTLILDLTGVALGGAAGYAGTYYPLLVSGPQLTAPADHSLATLLANLAFLQTVTAPVYGSNGPLWSLANEFWYYVVFPLAASAFLIRGKVWIRIISGVSAAVIAYALPFGLMLLGLIWVAGALASAMASADGLRKLFAHPSFGIVALLSVVASLAIASRIGGLAADLLSGLAWCALLPVLAALAVPLGSWWGRLYSRVAHALSEVSFTLYATHFPIIIFVYFVWIAPHKLQPGLTGLSALGGGVLLALLFSTALWWCFERNTQNVRAAFSSLVGRAKRGMS